MDSNSTCHNSLDPALLLEMSSIIKNNMENMQKLTLPPSYVVGSEFFVAMHAIRTISESVYNTNSVLDALLSSIIDSQFQEPTSNISYNREN